jgi:hypothetical protein
MNIDEDPDERTRRLAVLAGASGSLEPLAARCVLIELSPDAAASPTAALAFLTVCNLATRLGAYLPNLDILVPPSPVVDSRVYPPAATLHEQALWVIRSATCTEHLSRGEKRDRVYDLSIVVGGEAQASALERIFVGWEGWTGIIATEPKVCTATNPIGALIAAAMSVAKLHAQQLRVVGAKIPEASAEWRLNALTLDDGNVTVELPSQIEAPESMLVGGGALGSTFTYLLTHIPELRASVAAVDHDVLKATNANRQITAPFTRADAKTPKVEDLAAAWSAIRPIQARYEELKAKGERSAGAYAIAVTAVDTARVRREVANDLPKVILDGATGGLTVFVMRGEDPTVSCVACRYAPVVSDDDGEWAIRLGVSRAEIERLRRVEDGFSEDVLRAIKENGTYPWDPEVEEGLRVEGWKYLERHACGDAKPERDLPAASVSYVSALCGFLMGAQYIAEVLGASALEAPLSTWTWSDVLREPPARAVREAPLKSRECAARHERRSRLYRKTWSEPDESVQLASTSSASSSIGTSPNEPELSSRPRRSEVARHGHDPAFENAGDAAASEVGDVGPCRRRTV